MKTKRRISLVACGALCLVAAGAAAGEGVKVHRFEKELPEGNYTVTVKLGSGDEATATWVKAEMRQLVLENIRTKPGEFAVESFTVNLRTPRIDRKKGVKINEREKTAPRWDDKLSLEFLGNHPEPVSVDIQPAPDAVTVFLAGDSTVCDQGGEPWAGWGQMLPVFFRPGVAVANHAESGLSARAFWYQRRLAKVLDQMKPGDFFLVQFGHNDQKEKPREETGPYTSYKNSLEGFIDDVRKQKGVPVLVTPMERKPRTGKDGKPYGILAREAEIMRQVAADKGVPVIDLNAMSLRFYNAGGAAKAFVDNSHHNNYGAYELAKCVVEGIKAEVPELAKHLRPDLPAFDPGNPDANVDIPPSPGVDTEKPAGD